MKQYADPMKAQNERDERTTPTPKAPYQRPELKRVGTLRDVTARTSGPSPDAD